MSYDVIPTVCVCVVVVFAIQAVTIYSVVRLFTTGRTLFERKPDSDRARIIHGETRYGSER